MEHKDYKAIHKSVRKKDAMQLLLGKPVYTDDVTDPNSLIVKILRSPHPNAIVKVITTAPAIAHAIYRATGVWHRNLPITPEDIALTLNEF